MTNGAAEKVKLDIVPDAKEVFGRRHQRFAHIAAELRGVNEAKKQLEKESKTLTQQLVEMWADVPTKTVIEDGARVTLVSSSSSHISKEALLEAGVAASVIIKATKSTPYQFVKKMGR